MLVKADKSPIRLYGEAPLHSVRSDSQGQLTSAMHSRNHGHNDEMGSSLEHYKRPRRPNPGRTVLCAGRRCRRPIELMGR